MKAVLNFPGFPTIEDFVPKYNDLENANLTLIPIGKSGIHIKKENKGKFTEYCGGKVTDECINRGKNSSNPSIRKQATFAKNARVWKHQSGGTLNKYMPGLDNLDLSGAFTDLNITPTEFERKAQEFSLTLPSLGDFTYTRKSTKKDKEEKEEEIPTTPISPVPFVAQDTPINNTSSTRLDNAVRAYSGINYVYGGNSKNGIDCSAFTQSVIKNLGGNIGRTAQSQYAQTSRVSKADLKPGDLVFLQNTNKNHPKGSGVASHVEIVTDVSRLNEGIIGTAGATSSGTKSGTHTRNLNSGYFKNNWLGAGRVSGVAFGRFGMKFAKGDKVIDYSKYMPGIKEINFKDAFTDLNIVPSQYETLKVTLPSIEAPRMTVKTEKAMRAVKEAQDEAIARTSSVPVVPLGQLTPVEIGDNISDNMFNNLLDIEGRNNLTAKTGTQFGETFVTGPYGMVYKRNSNGDIIGTFKEGETMSQEAALQNAKYAYYKSTQEWKDLLKGKEGLTQNRLDALVSASGGTTKSKQALQNYVVNHWGDWSGISNYLRTYATTSAGNHKVQPGLVLRRLFEADWFDGNKRDFKWYQLNRKKYNV